MITTMEQVYSVVKNYAEYRGKNVKDADVKVFVDGFFLQHSDVPQSDCVWAKGKACGFNSSYGDRVTVCPGVEACTVIGVTL